MLEPILNKTPDSVDEIARKAMNKSSAKKFGENMKRIRLEKGMSQGDICRVPDLDRSCISNVENGKQNLTLSTMEKIAEVFGVSISLMLE